MISSNKVTVVLVVFSLLAGFAIYGYQNIELEEQEESYDTRALVEDPEENYSLGIDTGENLDFGKIFKGSNVTKTLDKGIPENKTTYVKVETKGNISKHLKFDEKHLLKNDSEIEIMMNGKKAGLFEGEILLDIKTALNNWGEKWIELQYYLP